jgi:putative membrane protein
MTRDVSTRALAAAARLIARRRLDLTVEGRERVPATGPLLIVARHVHHLHDGAALISVVPRPLRILVALDWIRDQATRRMMETATALARWPVVLRGDALAPGPDGHPRNTGGAYRRDEALAYQLRGMRTGLRLLAEGAALAIFPEAYPNVDPGWTPKRSLDELLPFRPGFASLAAMARDHRGLDVPIVPTGLQFRRTAGARWTVAVRFGEPLSLGSRRPADLVTEAQARVAELSGVPAALACRTGERFVSESDAVAEISPRAETVAAGRSAANLRRHSARGAWERLPVSEE